MLETLRPDPTFYPSPKLAMEAPAENYAYVLMLSPDGSQPDALGVVDVQLGSSTYGTLVHTVAMPNKGDEFHHFGWNACSSALSPLTGSRIPPPPVPDHPRFALVAHLHRRYRPASDASQAAQGD